jgi:hypothetical protein
VNSCNLRTLVEGYQYRFFHPLLKQLYALLYMAAFVD